MGLELPFKCTRNCPLCIPGGDKSEFTLKKNGLSGNNATVYFNTRQDGGIIFGPLTGEFLYLPEKSPQVGFYTKCF